MNPPQEPFTASIMVNEGCGDGDKTAYCLMAAFRSEEAARAAFEKIAGELKRWTPALAPRSSFFGKAEDRDMAEVGSALMATLTACNDHPALKYWAPLNCPSEIVVDLLNALDEVSQTSVTPWRQIADGPPPWTDDPYIRVLAVTADDDFAGVKVHDISASDFHQKDEDGATFGTEVTQCCTHWAYRDDVWPHVMNKGA